MGDCSTPLSYNLRKETPVAELEHENQLLKDFGADAHEENENLVAKLEKKQLKLCNAHKHVRELCCVIESECSWYVRIMGVSKIS